MRLSSGLQRLQREGETVAELLNMAADFDNTPRLQQGVSHHVCVMCVYTCMYIYVCVHVCSCVFV